WIRGAATSRRLRILEMFVPYDLALFDIDGKQVVGRAGDERHLLRSGRGIDLFHDERGKERMHLPRLIGKLELPHDFHVLDIGLGEDFFVLLPAVAGGPVTVGEPIRAPGKHAAERDAGEEYGSSHVPPRFETIQRK